MKKRLFVLPLCFLLLFSACGGTAEPPETTPADSPSPTAAPTPALTPTPTPTPTPEPTPEPTGPAAWTDATIAFGGDVLIYGQLARALHRDGTGVLMEDSVAEVFRDADLAMINLESPFSHLGAPWPGKDFAFRSDPDDLAVLRDFLGIDVVSLANNHTIDYGVDAFLDTLVNLEQFGIGYTGGGENLEAAMRPFVAEAGGRSVAFLAGSQVAPRMEWYALEDRPGLLMTYDATLLSQAIRESKEEHDFVIVYLHWGIEHTTQITSVQRNTARILIEAGADAVIGAHPHIIQSFEVYNGRPIAYSLGNFLFNMPRPDTAYALLHFTGEELWMEIVPLRKTGFRLSPAEPEFAAERLRFWDSISENGRIDENGRLWAAE